MTLAWAPTWCARDLRLWLPRQIWRSDYQFLAHIKDVEWVIHDNLREREDQNGPWQRRCQCID